MVHASCLGRFIDQLKNEHQDPDWTGVVCRKVEEDIGKSIRPVPQTQSPLLRRDLHLNEGYTDTILKVVTLEPWPLHFPFALGLAHYAASSERDSINLSASRNWKLLGRPSWVSPYFCLAQHSALHFGANEKSGEGDLGIQFSSANTEGENYLGCSPWSALSQGFIIYRETTLHHTGSETFFLFHLASPTVSFCGHKAHV